MKLFSVFFLLFAAMQIAAENLPDWIKTGPDGVMRIFEDSVTINSDGKAELREIIAIKKISLPAKFSLKILSKDDFKRIKKKEIIMEEPFYFPEFFGKGILPCERIGRVIKCALENDSTLKIEPLKAEEKPSALFSVILILLFFSAVIFPALDNMFEDDLISAEKVILFADLLALMVFVFSFLLGANYLVKLFILSRVPFFPTLPLFLAALLSAFSGICFIAGGGFSMNYWKGKYFLSAAFICLFSGITIKAPWIGGILFSSGILSFFISKKIAEIKASEIFKKKYC